MKKELANNETNCYNCIHMRTVPGNCHISCSNGDPEMSGNQRAIEKGWFFYPILFDPIWKERICNNFESR